jgi:hypothetical protein
VLRIVWVQVLNDSPPWRYDIQQSQLQLVLRRFGIEMAWDYGHTAMGAVQTS